LEANFAVLANSSKLSSVQGYAGLS